jgi:hypothetical protein
MLVTMEGYTNDLQYITTNFNLREGAFTGINVNSLQAYVGFSLSPVPEFIGNAYITWSVTEIISFLDGPFYIIPTIPIVTFPCFPTQLCIQNNHVNVQAADDQCGPAAVANSLQYLENNNPGKINIPHNNNMGLKGDNTLVGKLDTLSNRNIVNRRNGDPVHCRDLLQAKLQYINDEKLFNDIKVKHQSPLVPNDMVVSVVTSKNKGENGKDITIDWIIAEICAGEDVGVLFNWREHAEMKGHFVDLTAAGYICGIPFIWHVSDQDQTDDNLGCNSIQCDFLKKGPLGFLEVISGDTPTGAYMVWACSQSPNNRPPAPNLIPGPNRLKPNQLQQFSADPVEDPDGDAIKRYEWDFDGDGKVDLVTEEPTCEHAWPKKGEYRVRVRARDEYGAVSEWSEPLYIRVPISKTLHLSFLQLLKDLFQNHPSILLFLQQFLHNQ